MPIRPPTAQILIVTNGVAIGRDSPFAAHVRLTFVSHGPQLLHPCPEERVG